MLRVMDDFWDFVFLAALAIVDELRGLLYLVLFGSIVLGIIVLIAFVAVSV